MSLYRIHFRWKEKDVSLRARGLDLTHPYFVSMTELQFPTENSRIIDPTQDELRRDFGSAKNVMIPIGNVSLIEELDDSPPVPGEKIKPFKVIDGDDDTDEDTDDDPDDEPEADDGAPSITDTEDDSGDDPNSDTPPIFPHRES